MKVEKNCVKKGGFEIRRNIDLRQILVGDDSTRDWTARDVKKELLVQCSVAHSSIVVSFVFFRYLVK